MAQRVCCFLRNELLYELVYEIDHDHSSTFVLLDYGDVFVSCPLGDPARQ